MPLCPSSGVIEVISDTGQDSQLEGTEIFDLLGSFVSINDAPARLTQQAYVSVNTDENTGIAAYNPDSDASATLDLVLLDSVGIEKATQQLVLQPRQRLAIFIDDEMLFGEFFDGNPEEFKGTLNVRVVGDQEVSMVSLLQRRDTGALIGVATSDNAFAIITE